MHKYKVYFAIPLIAWLLIIILFSSSLAILYLTLFEVCHAKRLWLQQTYPALFLGISPLVMAFSAWCCLYFSPGASGSGHELSSQFLTTSPAHLTFQKEGVLQKYFSLRIIIVKMASSLLGVIGGSALGKEGPLVHIMTALWVLFSKRFSYFSLETALIVGSSLGFVAVFSSPFI